jgi:hypothetical protein
MDEDRIGEELRHAYDFDPRDPLFGLSRAALSGPHLDRRTTLRLLAAAGTLSAWEPDQYAVLETSGGIFIVPTELPESHESAASNSTTRMFSAGQRPRLSISTFEHRRSTSAMLCEASSTVAPYSR